MSNQEIFIKEIEEILISHNIVLSEEAKKYLQV